MKRRHFLGATAAGVALALLPIPVFCLQETPPKLWGDGLHDDTHAIQWRLDRGGLFLKKGTYLVMQPLNER